MKEKINFTKEIEFENNIGEISSISLEMNYKYDNNKVDGEFILEGTYKTNRLSINKDNFNYSIPFTYEIKENIDESTLSANITDFTYKTELNSLILDIEYKIEADIKPLEEEELDRFLEEKEEIDVVDIREEKLEPVKEINYEERLKEQLSSSEDKYITYHVYVVTNEDTIEGISNRFKISIDDIKKYNDIEEIKFGMKIIIPYEYEENN